MSPARSIIDRAFLALVVLVSWSHRRSTCTHRKRHRRWPANNFGSREACTSPCAEERTADQRRAAGNGHLTTTSEGSVHCLNCFVSDMYQQHCLDSAGESSWQQDDSRYWTRRLLSWLNSVAIYIDQNSACLDTDSDAYCRVTPHGTVAPTASVDLLLLRLAGGRNVVASTSTAKQLGSNDDGVDDPTLGQLPARQPDSNDGTDVSMAYEQQTRQPGGNDETRSLPWWLIPGFKFLPTDQELVLHYLQRKVLNLGLPEHNAVREGEDVYGLNAAEITLDVNNRDKEMLGFFFVRKERGTYSNGCFYTTPDGYWKVRGRPAPIKHCGRVIAFKTSLGYYHGRAPHGCRTPWSMLEYALNTDQLDLRNLERPSMNSYVVCKVRKRERASVRATKWSGLARHLRLKKRVEKNRHLETKATARRGVGGVSGVLGKRKRHNMF